MLKKTKSIYVIELFLTILLVAVAIITNGAKREFYSIVGIAALLFASLLVYGIKKDRNALKVSATRIIISVLLFHFIIVFFLGLSLGFNKTLFTLDVSQWFNGLIPAFFLTVVMEYLRFLLISSNPFDRKGIYYLTLLLILFNICINANYATLIDGYGVFVFICVVVCPAIAQELLSSYITYQFGLLPNLVYKLIMNLYLYVIPIMTDLGNYLYGAFNIVMPVVIFITLNRSIHFANDARRNSHNVAKVILGFAMIPTFVLLVVLVVLVSGIYDYQMIAVASDSMVPSFARGDAIIFEKINDENDIFIGDVLVFKRDDRIVAHRVNRITITPFGKAFYTKGDANKGTDSGYAVFEDVRGVARSTVKYVGYPTVLFNELIGGE